MNDEAALFAAILREPAEDTPRLMYADAIEERDSARAEFIRVQIWIANWEAATRGNLVSSPEQCRESELLLAYWRDWSPVRPAACSAGEYNPSHDNAERGVNAYFRRGFVHQVACPAPEWLGMADNVRPLHPITSVIITTPVRGLDLPDSFYLPPFRSWRDIEAVHMEYANRTDSETGMPILPRPSLVWADIFGRRWPGVTFQIPD